MASNSLPEGSPRRKKNLLDDIREVMRLRHYSIRTEQAYFHWDKRF